MKIGLCERCKRQELLTLYRGWFLCWDCTDKFMKMLGIKP